MAIMRSLLLAGAVLSARQAGVSATSSSTSSASPAVHTITVGKGGNMFSPDSLSAAVGDIVSFQFYPANHSVAEAAYMYPCEPIQDVVSGAPGFFSGFEPVASLSSPLPVFNITINSTDPVFYYCTALGSCLDYGMVGAINPNSSTPVSAQIQMAKTAQYMLQPGETVPAEGTASSSMAMASATASSTPSASSTAAATSSSGTSLSGGAIGGIVVGGIVVLAAVGAAIYFFARSKTLNETLHLEKATVQTQPRPSNVGQDSFIGKGMPSPYVQSVVTTPMTQNPPMMPNDPNNNRWGPLPPYQQYQDYKQTQQGFYGPGASSHNEDNMSHPGSVRSNSPSQSHSMPYMGMHIAQQQQGQPQWGYDARPMLQARTSSTPSELTGEGLARNPYGAGGLAAVHELDAYADMSPEEAMAAADMADHEENGHYQHR